MRSCLRPAQAAALVLCLTAPAAAQVTDASQVTAASQVTDASQVAGSTKVATRAYETRRIAGESPIIS